MNEIKKQIYDQLLVPRVTVKYETERSEHFGQIRSHLTCKMALENPARIHELSIKLPEVNVCDEVKEVFDYLEDVEMKVFDDKGYGLFLRPDIACFMYADRKLTIRFYWRKIE